MSITDLHANTDKILYVSDLDGTLLNDRGELPQSAKETLTELLAAGCLFTIASARSVASMHIVLDDLPVTLPVIGGNGAYLSDYQSGENLFINSLDSDVAREVLRIVREHDLEPIVTGWRGNDNHLSWERIANDGMKLCLGEREIAEDPRLRQLADLRESLAETVVSLTVIAGQESAAALELKLGEAKLPLAFVNYENTYTPGWYWLTIYAAGTSKGEGLKRLKEYAGLEDVYTVAFGDNANDISLLEAADHGVAVANAPGLVQNRAQEVIGSNEAGSVPEYLRKHFLARSGV